MAQPTLYSLGNLGIDYIRGVNLGSTFVPENWMVPSFYAGTGTKSFCGFVRALNATEAEARMRAHLDAFITEDDFAWLAARGFNAVRIPIGWWNALSSRHQPGAIPYVPSDAGASYRYLDRYFAWARAHGLAVLLDLHGAPGSQNGNDHSGCDDGIHWVDDPANIELTLLAVGVLVRRYGAHPAFLGIELLNEPAWAVEWLHDRLLEYYLRALALVREVSDKALVVFNVLYWDDFPAGFGNWWSGQVTGPNVALDLHLYDCYGNASQRTVGEHLAQATKWANAIETFQARGHPVLIGEWSLATGVHQGGQAWADAQLDAFKKGLGWFFWSYKKEGLRPGDDGGDTWSLRGVVRSGVRLGAGIVEVQDEAADEHADGAAGPAAAAAGGDIGAGGSSWKLRWPKGWSLGGAAVLRALWPAAEEEGARGESTSARLWLTACGVLVLGIAAVGALRAASARLGWALQPPSRPLPPPWVLGVLEWLDLDESFAPSSWAFVGWESARTPAEAWRAQHGPPMQTAGIEAPGEYVQMVDSPSAPRYRSTSTPERPPRRAGSHGQMASLQAGGGEREREAVVWTTPERGARLVA